jgi:uncharacterized protein YhfF
MKKTPEVQAFWEKFCELHPETDPSTPYQVWYFGLTPDTAAELADLVLTGPKRATASLPWEYETQPDEAPVLGGFSVVTDFNGVPKCVVRTTELQVVPFNAVTAEFAFDEGEGDRSLDYWRAVHWDYFSRRAANLGREANNTMPVICERFELLYPSSKQT